jgi:antitoxin component YwqK of YwqJK toxin-antitoxin module
MADNVYTTVRSFYEDGTLASEINYVNNRPYGLYQFYYPDGTLMEEGVWNEKHLTGNFKRYYANGQLAQEFYYDEEGKRVGRQKYFYQSGSLQAEKQMGPPEHIVVRYTTDGQEKVYISF